jgi:transcriptional regulator with XRE-family HTH domain
MLINCAWLQMMKPRSKYFDKPERKRLAERIGTTTSTVTQILNRKRGAGYQLACRLAHATGQPESTFLDWRESRNSIYLCAPLAPRANPFGNSFWSTRGKKAAIARAARILPATLGNIIRRRSGASWAVALRLAGATQVPSTEWMNARTSTHPAFYGMPERSA